MLRTRILSFLRSSNPILISSLSNNLHTSPISTAKEKSKQGNQCESTPIAIVLCGCGALDGTEISEALSATIHICQKGMTPKFYAPDVEICEIVNHLTKETCPSSEPRNALIEAARIARSSIEPLCECKACRHGALIIPGGFGTASILSNFAEKGANCTVLPELHKLIEEFNCGKKPIGSICMASVIIAKVLKGVKITLGKDSPKEQWPYYEAIKRVKDMGAKIELKDVKGVTRCKKYNVYSTPAWLYQCANYGDVHEGIGNLINMLKKSL